MIALRTDVRLPLLRDDESIRLALRELVDRCWLACNVVIPHPQDLKTEAPATVTLHPKLGEMLSVVLRPSENTASWRCRPA